MLRSSDTAAPITPTKRPLTELFTAAKRMDGNDVISKKRKLSISPSRVDSRDEKENRQTTDAQMYTTAGESQTPQASLPTPLSTPTNIREQSDAPIATTPPKSISTIPHIFAHAHLLLSTSSPLTSSLPLSGRSDQLETLLAFLTRRFPKVYSTDPFPGSTVPNPRGPGPAALYASGPPGIGKTALLNSVLGEFVNKVEGKELGEEVRVCMRNCSTVGLGETAWERLGTGLGMDWKFNGGATKHKGKELFEQGLRDGKKYLLILDEIDHLCTTSNGSSSAPDLLNALFSLASIPSSPLTLIGIANDLTLKALNLSSPNLSPTSRLALGKGKAKLDPLTTPTKPINLHFAPYSWQELVKIVHQRLELLSPTYPISLDQALSSSSPSPSTSPSSVLPKTFPLIDKIALERAAKKVATTTGDVRTILDLVRKSISLSTSALDPDSLATFTLSTAPKASMKHMTLSLSSSTGLSTAPSLSTRLESLNPNHRFVLVSLTIALSRTLSLGLETFDQTLSSQSRITLEEGWKVYREVLSHEESLKSVSHSSKDGFRQAVEMVQDLGGFVTVNNGTGGASTSPNSKRRKTPSPSKKGGNQTLMVISGSESAPIDELVKLFSPLSSEGAGSLAEKEDESTRLCRKMISRELSDQRWKRKLVAMGRDEEKRAEEELQGREWERSMKAQAHERGELC
ncbi:hypothetical protein JCM16303_001484 [Sporobolomyces ruberrimus]